MSESIKEMIEKNGLQGFFKNTCTPKPTGIHFDYDVEEVKRGVRDNNVKFKELLQSIPSQTI